MEQLSYELSILGTGLKTFRGSQWRRISQYQDKTFIPLMSRF